MSESFSGDGQLDVEPVQGAPENAPGAAPLKATQRWFTVLAWEQLGVMGAASGVIGGATLALELATHRALAQALGLPLAFASAPMGFAAVLLGLLTLRGRPLWSLPALVLGGLYWWAFWHYAPAA